MNKVFMNYTFFLALCLCNFNLVVGGAPSETYYVIEGSNNEKNSIFRTLFIALELLDQYEKGECSGLEISYCKDGKYYDEKRGPNWWEYCFKPLKLGNKTADNVKRLPNYKKTVLYLQNRLEMSIKRAHQLLKKYIHIHPEITDKALDQLKPYKDAYLIGVYHEKPSPSWLQKDVTHEKVFFQVQKSIPDTPSHYKIISLSNDEAFIAFMKKKFKDSVVATYIQDKKKDKASQAEDALIHAILLSKCNTLIRVSSHLGECASIMNPQLPVVELTESWLKEK